MDIEQFRQEYKELERRIAKSPVLHDLPTAARNELARNGLFSLEDFLQRTRREVASLQNVGPTTMRRLQEKGVVFKEGLAKKKKGTGEYIAWVISAKIGPGCYRHLQILQSETLFDLAEAILGSFNFENDHSHAFFLDNKFWSQEEAYFMTIPGEGTRKQRTEDVFLSQLNLKQKFKFVFDFGDEWRFDCQVLRAVETDETGVEIVREIGAAPRQYPGYGRDRMFF